MKGSFFANEGSLHMFSCYMSMICIGIFPVLAIYKKKTEYYL